MEMDSVDLKRLNGLFDCYGFPLGLPDSVDERRLKIDLLESRLFDDLRNVSYRPCVETLFREYCFVRSLINKAFPDVLVGTVANNFDSLIP